MNKSEIKKKLETLSFTPSKKMGQNFLHSNRHIKLIIEKLEIDESDNILEIGPGFGALTREILNQTQKLSLIEVDKRINEYLTQTFKCIEVTNKDVLKLDLNAFCNERKINKIVSNLPYSISSKIVVESLKCDNLEKMIFMVQKELADRFLAKPKTKNYNSLSVLLQTFTKIKKICDLKPECFFPEPKVTSTILLFEKLDNTINFSEFNSFIKNCFISKRKTLYNNLKPFYSTEKIIGILDLNNLNKNIRAEAIEVKLLQKIYLDFKNDN